MSNYNEMLNKLAELKFGTSYNLLDLDQKGSIRTIAGIVKIVVNDKQDIASRRVTQLNKRMLQASHDLTELRKKIRDVDKHIDVVMEYKLRKMVFDKELIDELRKSIRYS
jgi:hypothetical protein